VKILFYPVLSDFRNSSQASTVCPDDSIVYLTTSMKLRRNENERRKPKYSKNTVPQWHCPRQISQSACLGSTPDSVLRGRRQTAWTTAYNIKVFIAVVFTARYDLTLHKRAMALATDLRPLPAEARVRYQVICEICGEQVALGHAFLRVLPFPSVSPQCSVLIFICMLLLPEE
jgi:hypothetical protein